MRAKWMCIFAAATLIVFASGCDTGGGGAVLEIYNSHTSAAADPKIIEVYWSSTHGDWGTNRLGGTIATGNSITFEVPSGTYYIRAVAADSHSQEDPIGFPTIDGSADYYWWNFTN